MGDERGEYGIGKTLNCIERGRAEGSDNRIRTLRTVGKDAIVFFKE